LEIAVPLLREIGNGASMPGLFIGVSAVATHATPTMMTGRNQVTGRPGSGLTLAA